MDTPDYEYLWFAGRFFQPDIHGKACTTKNGNE
jgi:hypothetical protein